MEEIEIIVVDDNSNDGTDGLMRWFLSNSSKIRYTRNEKKMGAGESRNIGIDMAVGDIIGVCDDDDVYPVERASKIMEFYEKNGDGIMMNAPHVSIGYNVHHILERFDGDDFDHDEFKKSGKINYFCHPTAAYLKKDVIEIGKYKPENDQFTDDYQLVSDWVKAGKKIGFAKNDFLCMHRILPQSIMSNHRGFNPKWVPR
jgi:glycosyltransferase involved in cell wall biosynthesis